MAAIPGLSYPGLITVGPTFSIRAQAYAGLGVVANARVVASLEFPSIEFVFPKEEGKSSATAKDSSVPKRASCLSPGARYP